jgi:hypothetical protein
VPRERDAIIPATTLGVTGHTDPIHKCEATRVIHEWPSELIAIRNPDQDFVALAFFFLSAQRSFHHLGDTLPSCRTPWSGVSQNLRVFRVHALSFRPRGLGSRRRSDLSLFRSDNIC